MPLPPESFAIHGGCHCKAVQYVIHVPEHANRPITPYRTHGAEVGDATIPAVYLCHCPDCRATFTSIPTMALVTDITTVQVSLIPRLEVSHIPHGPLPDTWQRSWQPASGVFDFENSSLDSTFLSFYKASPKRTRWYCGRCGTSLAYNVDAGVIPPEWGWPTMLDIALPTVVANDLAHEYMKPERMLWCEKGIPWVRKWVRNGAGSIPEHPLTKIDHVFVDDDSVAESTSAPG